MDANILLFSQDLNISMTEIHKLLEHWGLEGWKECLVVRVPDKPESFIVLNHPSDKTDFAEQIVRLHRGGAVPLPMVLHCPVCTAQHIDAPEPETGWTNPPHKSHQCHSCGEVWRPADVPTVGVASIDTRGERDTWPYQPSSEASPEARNPEAVE